MAPELEIASYRVMPEDVGKTITLTLTDTSAPQTLANNKLALLGDSRIWRIDGDAVGSGGFMHQVGIALWARRYSGGAVQFNRALNFARPGYTTQDLIDVGLVAAAANSGAASVLVLAGVNDHYGSAVSPGGPVPDAQSLENIQAIADTLLAAGKTVFYCDECPANDAPGGIAHHVAIRDLIRSMAGTPNLYVVPSWNAMAVSPDSTAPSPYSEDGTHLGPRNASDIARVLLPLMQPILPAFDLFARPGVVAGGDFTGTSGAKLGGVTGTVPTGWTVALELGTGAVTCSMEQADGLNWLVVRLTNGAAPRIGIYSGNLSSGWIAGTDRIDMAARCRIDQGAVNIVQCQLLSRRTPTDMYSQLRLANGNGAYDGAIIGNTVNTIPPYAMDMIFWMPHVLYPAGTTAFNQRFEIRGISTGAPCSGTFRFALPQLRKYRGDLPD